MLKRLVSRVMLPVCKFSMNCVILPTAKWCAGDSLRSRLSDGPSEYTDPTATLNPLMIQRALDDIHSGWDTAPDTLQAELNGCMEGLRPKVAADFQGMMGALITRYPVEEAFVRMLSNAVHLGMYIERRIESGAGSEPSSQPAPSGDDQINGTVPEDHESPTKKKLESSTC